MNQSGIENFLTERTKTVFPTPQFEKSLSNDAKNIDNSILNNVQVSGLIVSFRSMEAKLLSRNNLPPPPELLSSQ